MESGILCGAHMRVSFEQQPKVAIYSPILRWTPLCYLMLPIPAIFAQKVISTMMYVCIIWRYSRIPERDIFLRCWPGGYQVALYAGVLTHWPLVKVAAISQTRFSSTVSRLKSFMFWFQFYWSLSNWQNVIIGSGNGLAPNRRDELTYWDRHIMIAILQKTSANSFSCMKITSLVEMWAKFVPKSWISSNPGWTFKQQSNVRWFNTFIHKLNAVEKAPDFCFIFAWCLETSNCASLWKSDAQLG